MQPLDIQLAAVQVLLVYRRDLQFAAAAGFDALGYFHHGVIIKVQAHHSVVRPRDLRLFLDAERMACGVEFHHAVALRIRDLVGENDAALRILAVGELAAEAVEDIIAEHECDAVIANEILANQEGLCESLRSRLDRVIDHEPELGAITKEALEGARIFRGSDDEDLPNARLDERG